MVKQRAVQSSETLQGMDPTEELIALRSKVAQMEEQNKERELAAGNSEGTYVKEMEELRKAKAQGLNEIIVKEICPKTVSLWHVSGHNIGKRVGPIDANNAEETFLRFAFFKIKVSMNRPSEEWIAKYKQTEEYKISAEFERKRRARKNGSAKESAIDKLIKLQAKQLGVNPEDLVEIKSQEEVKGLK